MLYGFELAERLGEPDPFALLASIPARLLTYWRARDRLRQPGRYETVQQLVQQEMLSAEELQTQQIASCVQLIRGAATQTKAREQRIQAAKRK